MSIFFSTPISLAAWLLGREWGGQSKSFYFPLSSHNCFQSHLQTPALWQIYVGETAVASFGFLQITHTLWRSPFVSGWFDQMTTTMTENKRARDTFALQTSDWSTRVFSRTPEKIKGRKKCWIIALPPLAGAGINNEFFPFRQITWKRLNLVYGTCNKHKNQSFDSDFVKSLPHWDKSALWIPSPILPLLPRWASNSVSYSHTNSN